ncbi:response regulator [Desulfococcaceae bacterium HSG8]|nr:response regulator [Desulfococcaceae bacterium HSG8]
MNKNKPLILIVDDNPINIKLLTDILQDDYQTAVAENGLEAISHIKIQYPDLILLDILMPGIDGYEVCARLKADTQTKDIAVIFITAMDSPTDVTKGFEAGASDYITKPFNVLEVKARVKNHLSVVRIREQLRAELIRSEKMAILGQIVAGVAHEIKTPLGAIQASIDNISDSLGLILEQLPRLLQSLPDDSRKDFFLLLDKALQGKTGLSAREERKLKRSLTSVLEEHGLDNADDISDTLTDMGIYDKIDPFLPLFQSSENQLILETAYNISGLQRNARNISTAAGRATKIVFALKSYAHYDHTGKKVESDLTQGIETILTLYQNQLKYGIEVIRNYEKLPPVLCYTDELDQVWANLINNAIQAMDGKGTLTIDIYQKESSAVVTITDSGKGIPDEIKTRIFEPFFTTKSVGEGSGLGLDIVLKIIDKHHGKIEAESEPGKTVFSVILPINS